MKVAELDFLEQPGESWTTRPAPDFSVANIHGAEIPMPAARIFPELGARDLLLPARRWRALFGLRLAIGKIFGWDRGLAQHSHEPLEPGKHYGFFTVQWVNSHHGVGMSVRNRLTSALLCWVLEDIPRGTKVFNVTLANFAGWQGRNYWRVIRAFHDAITTDSLKALARRVECQPAPPPGLKLAFFFGRTRTIGTDAIIVVIGASSAERHDRRDPRNFSHDT